MSNQTFRNLHNGPDILLLPNAWDAGSARLIESLGAKAIATTSRLRRDEPTLCGQLKRQH